LAITTQTAVIAAMIAAAGVLLVSETSSENEQRVFVIGTILLLAGAAAHLQLSELFTGLVAGIVLRRFHAVATIRFERDLRYLQHPLVALLFGVAGAHFGPTPGWMTLAIAYVVLMIAGKMFAGRLSAMWIPGVPRDAGLLLLAPGVVGVALALNASRFHGDSSESALLFAVVVAGAVAAEVLSVVLTRRDAAR
jgi:Kef-type K+ transport system membrane component KefB